MTIHSLAHLAMVSRSMFSNCVVTSGCFTIRYKLVSSAKKSNICMNLFTISLIKSNNNLKVLI